MTLKIQGKWHNIKKIVKGLVNDGWTVTKQTGEPDFIFTEVTLER